MKKLILALLFTTTFYGQAVFDEGVQITGGQTTDNSATKVNVQSANGTINTVDKTSIGTTRSTGLIKNGILSINADPTKYNLSAGSAVFSDFSNPDSVTSNVVNFSAVIGKTPTFLNTSNITYVGVNSSGAIEEKASPFTSIERRTIAPIGAVIHSNLLSINTINGIASPPNDVAGQMFDFMEAVGTLNTTGNVYSPSGANMMLNKSAGTLFKAGSNFYNDWRDPNKINQAAGTSITFRYRTQTGLEGVDRVTIDPDSYDVGGVVTAVPNNKWTIQTIYIFQSGLTRIQWGQTLYNSLSEAKNAIPTRSYIEEANNKLQGVKRCFLIVMKGETALNTFVTDRFNEAQKFGGTSSGGVALTNESVTAALGYTAANDANVVHKTGNETIGGIKTFDNLILSNNTSTGSGVQSENFATGIGILSTNYSPGTGIQANNTSTGKGIYSNNASSGDGIVSNGDISSTGFVYVGRNSGANTFTVNKLGNVTANSFIKSGGTSSQFLKADGSVDSNILSSNSSLSPPFYSENFSSGLFGSGWSSYGDAVWTIDVTDGNGDSFSAKSGDIVNLQRSVLVYSLTTTQETTALTFDYKTDSEPEYDWLEIKQNGKILDRFSGSNAWTTHTVYIQGIGTYDIQFVYEKDSGVSVGSDTVWIDNVKFSNDYQPTQVTNAVSFNNDVYFQNGLVTKDAYIENAVLKGSVRIYNFDEHNFATQLYRWGLLFKSPSGVTFGINSGETSDNSYSFHAQNGVTKTKMGYQTGYENGFIELPDLNAKTSFGGLLNSSYTLKNYGNSSFIGSSYFSDVVTIGSETAPVTAQLNISKSDVFGNYIYMEDVAASRKSLLFQGNSNSLDIVGFSFNSYTFNDIILRAQGSGNDQLRLKTSGNISIGNNNDSYKLDVSGTGRFSSTLTANSFIKSGGTSDQFLKADGSSDSSVYAPLASPTLTGTPTAPTAIAGTNTTQIATTAFVQENKNKLKGYTVATLPAGTIGDMAYVTDATGFSYNSTVVGGGTGVTPVFFDGTSWRAR